MVLRFELLHVRQVGLRLLTDSCNVGAVASEAPSDSSVQRVRMLTLQKRLGLLPAQNFTNAQLASSWV
jgi:hypothetical protein